MHPDRELNATDGPVLYTLVNGVSWLTINRPELGRLRLDLRRAKARGEEQEHPVGSHPRRSVRR